MSNEGSGGWICGQGGGGRDFLMRFHWEGHWEQLGREGDK